MACGKIGHRLHAEEDVILNRLDSHLAKYVGDVSSMRLGSMAMICHAFPNYSREVRKASANLGR